MLPAGLEQEREWKRKPKQEREWERKPKQEREWEYESWWICYFSSYGL